MRTQHFGPPFPAVVRAGAAFCLVIVFLGGCRKKKEGAQGSAVAKRAAVVDKRDSGGDAALLRKIEALTGARTKFVWAEALDPKDPDPFSVGDNQVLKGLDTRDPRGERILLGTPDNYSRPLLTHDGGAILFTGKRISRDKKGRYSFDLRIFRTDWAGTRPREVAEGYAVDTWREPATGREWVCAVRNVPPQNERTFNARALVRFPLDDPKKTELLWDSSQISPDNIQFSRDGKACSALLPWPKAGALTFDGTEAEPHRYSHGCWPSMAPDNSRVSWVFDGSHKSATFFADDGARSWKVSFNDAPHFRGSEVYHPRWTNHPRFLVVTGPYLARRGGISSGGRTAQVNLGKLSAKLDRIEECIQVTDNNRGATFPAAWIEGGDKSELAEFTVKSQKNPVTEAASWPVNGNGLALLWHDRSSMNSFRGTDGKAHATQLEAAGAARHGRFGELLLDGGSFKVAGDSEPFVLGALKGKPEASFEALIIPPPDVASADGTIFSMPAMHLRIASGRLIAGSLAVAESLPGKPFHLAVITSPTRSRIWINGKETATAPAGEPAPASPEAVTFGSWTGGLMRIALYNRALTAAEIAPAASLALEAAAKFPPPPPRAKLLAKLADASPVPALADIEPYTASLVVCIYDVETVLSGQFTGKRVLVKHWGLLNRRPTAVFPRETGKTFELTLEPESAHPELKGERVSDESGIFDLDPWLDVTTPALK